jgi:hypothetical protein
MAAIRKAVLVGTRAEFAKRTPVVRSPHTIDGLRTEIASLEHHYGVSTRDLKRGQHVPRHVVSRWLSLQQTLLRLLVEQVDAERTGAA